MKIPDELEREIIAMLDKINPRLVFNEGSFDPKNFKTREVKQEEWYL